MNPSLASGRSPHIPVLYHEIIHVLKPHRGGFYIDGTLGAGSHAWGILEASTPDGRLLGFDVDPMAVELTQQRLAPFGNRAIIVKASFTTLPAQMSRLGWERVDGVLLDLGVSSMQFDRPERGFSFQADAPLDMRFDPDQGMTAAELLNSLPESDLADLIYRYGEERKARQCARAIVSARPILTTHQLAEVIRRAIGKRYEGRIDPATRTFQALRIMVNSELTALETFLPLAMAALAPGGILAVIAFHSLEDRLVKQVMRRESRDCICPPRQPVCTCGHRASLREITRHPVRPQPEEIQANPRARSARLRAAEKLALADDRKINTGF